jgi:hypothetical protein
MKRPCRDFILAGQDVEAPVCSGTPLAHGKSRPPASLPVESRLSGVIVMKQICYLFWLAGMATLVAYGWSDNLMRQVSDVVQFVGQLVAFVTI